MDIDGPKYRSDRYDPSYGWSIWANERKLEVAAQFLSTIEFRLFHMLILFRYHSIYVD